MMSSRVLLLAWCAGLLIGVVAKAWIFRGKPVRWKRQWQSSWYVMLGTYAMLGVYGLTGSAESFLVTGPAAAAFVIVANRATKVCDVCGAICITINWRATVHYCSRCGARLDLRTPGPRAAAPV